MGQYDDLDPVPANPPRMGMPSASGGRSLGKLAQSARGGELKKAAIILFVIAGLSMLQGFMEYSTVEAQVDAVIAKELQGNPGAVVDPAVRLQIINIAKMVASAFFVLGGIYIVLGLMIRKFPVPISILSLTLYLGVMAILALLNPLTLVQGWIIKIIAIVGLSKAIQAAFAYKREMAMERASMKPRFGGGGDFS